MPAADRGSRRYEPQRLDLPGDALRVVIDLRSGNFKSSHPLHLCRLDVRFRVD